MCIKSSILEPPWVLRIKNFVNFGWWLRKMDQQTLLCKTSISNYWDFFRLLGVFSSSAVVFVWTSVGEWKFRWLYLTDSVIQLLKVDRFFQAEETKKLLWFSCSSEASLQKTPKTGIFFLFKFSKCFISFVEATSLSLSLWKNIFAILVTCRVSSKNSRISGVSSLALAISTVSTLKQPSFHFSKRLITISECFSAFLVGSRFLGKNLFEIDFNVKKCNPNRFQIDSQSILIDSKSIFFHQNQFHFNPGGPASSNRTDIDLAATWVICTSILI